MTSTFFAGAMALALATPAHAQSMGAMPGMSMPVHPGPRQAVPNKPVAKKPVAKGASEAPRKTIRPVAAKPVAQAPESNARAPTAALMTAMPGMTMPVADLAQPGPAMDPAMPGMDHSAQSSNDDSMAGMNSGNATPGMAHDAMGGMAMKGALGPYAGSREASGTAWQPDTSADAGIMSQAGSWIQMFHGNLNLVSDTQGGPRGADKALLQAC